MACDWPAAAPASRFVETFTGSLRDACLTATGFAARIKAQGLPMA